VSFSLSKVTISHAPMNSSATLGIYVSYANGFHPLEVISTEQIAAPVGLIEVQSRIARRNLWISISFDHVRNRCMNLCKANNTNRQGQNRMT